MEGERAMEADAARKDAQLQPARGSLWPPSRGHAGQVEERILDAAGRIFLEHGFQGASVDEIAEAASAGKPTIYARFPNSRRCSPPSSSASCGGTPAITLCLAPEARSRSASTPSPPLS